MKGDPNDSLHDSLHDVEAMIRSAGQFVEPSRDLRPRLLETVRTEKRRERRHRRTTALLIPTLLLSVFFVQQTLRVRQTLFDASPREQVARSMGSGLDRFGWGLVDAFWQVQQKQAQAFSPSSRSDHAQTGEFGSGGDLSRISEDSPQTGRQIAPPIDSE